MKKVILMGYMGSGKSTIASILSQRLHFVSKDLDELIEKELNLSIKNIFESKGEVFFRKQESKILQSELEVQENSVLSLGGGTPCYGNNIDLIVSKNTTSIYLKAGIDTILERVALESYKRPLLSGLNEFEKREFIAKQLFERSFFYNQASFCIRTDHKSPEEVATEIEKLLI